MKKTYNFKSIKFVHSLQRMIPLLFLLLFASTMITVFVVNFFIAKDKFILENHNQILEKGKTVSNHLLRDLSYAESLAKAMAQAAKSLPQNETIFKETFPHFFLNNRITPLIAGGGIWPMPFMFSRKKERSSFFWAKNSKTNKYEFYDDYNDPKGNGYHNEEWFVPAGFIKSRGAYWSKSYIDPYSNEPMVTVSVPYHNEKEVLGISTIDLKLNRLRKTLAKEAKSISGYIILLDRNNKLLSFPENDQSDKSFLRDIKTNEYINFNTLVNHYGFYSPLKEIIDEHDSTPLFESDLDSKIIETLKKRVAGISSRESKLVAYSIANSDSEEVVEIGKLQISNDLILKEDSFVSIFEIPLTHWKIIIASPVSFALKSSNEIFITTSVSLFVVLFILISVVYLYLQKRLVSPLKSMGDNLEKFDETKLLECEDLPIVVDNELGQITQLINYRTNSFKQQKLRTDNALKVKGQFLAAMSHEIRTPLNGVIGVLDLLIDSGLTAQQKELTDIINTSSRSLLTIIDDILDFSKLEEFKLKIKYTPYPIKNLVEECASLYSSSLRLKDVQVVLDFSKTLPELIILDEVRVKQVLNNLLSNAIKFTDIGRVRVSVYERKIKENYYKVFIVITDSGIGIAKSDLNKLFKSFSQVDTGHTRSYGGTGLGLVISQKICKLMGGDLAVSSILGIGSTFTASFETKEVYQNDQARSKERETTDLEDYSNKLSILIVEDNLINQKVIGMLLDKLGFNFEIANNGLEALDCLKEKKFNIILMDIQMPVMNGLDCTSKIRKIYKKRDQYIVALTANALEEDRRRCIEAGANQFETKPITKEKLSNIFKKYQQDSQAIVKG